MELYVDRCTAITDVALGAIAEHCPGLTWLDVRGCSATDVGLGAIMERIPGLRMYQ
jgi:hypothetical protein